MFSGMADFQLSAMLMVFAQNFLPK